MGAICCSTIENKYEEERDTEPEQNNNNENVQMKIHNFKESHRIQ